MSVSDLREFFVETPKGRLFVSQWVVEGGADKAPIILLHDSLGAVSLWRDFPVKLVEATGRSVVAYDRLGFGRSDPYPGAIPMDFIRREAIEGLGPVCQALGLDRWVLLGHSVGGGMAVPGGAAYPDQTEAVVTIAAQAFVENLTRAGIREAEILFADEAQLARLARYHGDKARWVLDAWMGPWLSAQFDNWSLNEDLEQLKAPLLVLHGDADEYGSKAQAERLRDHASAGAQMHILKDCHHMPHKEKTDEVLGLIVSFLDGAASPI